MKHIGPAIKIFLFFTILTGLGYPLLVTGIGQLIFPKRAGGEFVSQNGQTVGAVLIGQKFVGEKYFWGRPSSVDYNPLSSGGSNLGPTSEALKKAVIERAAQIRKVHGLSESDGIPAELLFASASGLDPEISPAAAYFQVGRVAKARGIADPNRLLSMIKAHEKRPDLGFLGEPRVNVLELNLALDEVK